MRRQRILCALPVVAAALLAVPLESDGVTPCPVATTSLSSTLNDPVAGDEKFFTLPVGPSNVMFMLDVSGSMANIPQCGDANAWGDSSALATCQWPTFGTVSNPSTAGQVNGDGTCTVSGNLAWMTSYVPQTTLVDPGNGVASNGLADNPPWGTGCTGNNCLFQPTAVYAYDSWNETSATPTADPCTVSFNYTDFNCATKLNQTYTFTGTLPNCAACLTDTGAPGFFFYDNWIANYQTHITTGTGPSKHCTGALQTNYWSGGGTSRVLFSGGWLNANPPKFMSARKVVKTTAWIDPNIGKSTDALRLGLSYMSTAITNGAAIVVPIGPSQADSNPVNPPAYVAARQLILDALNHTHGGLAGWPTGITPPALANGGTPMATGLFHVGQYFSQPGTYSSAFGATYELNAFKENVSGVMQAPWVTGSTATICWWCQKSMIIIVTDGSPNTEMTFPASLKTYDQNVYTLPSNCGPGTKCSGAAPLSNCCSPSDSTANPPSMVPRVAAWLDGHDVVPSALNGTQNVTVAAVSFNLPAGKAQTILQSTANMGGGTYNNAADGTALAAGVAQAISQVSTTPTSFGAPAATALTTVNAFATKAFITRFIPNQKATWQGHLFEWMLFDEAAAGCDPAKKPNPDDPTQQVVCRGKTVLANFDGETTADGFNVCTQSFLVDADCDEVVEDSNTGLWYKKGTGIPGTPAHMFWDAGQVLSTPSATGYRTAAEQADAGNIAPYTQYGPGKTPRNIWTALPDGSMWELETKNAATLAPYMNLDQTWCSTFEGLAKLCGSSPLPTCPVTIAGNWQTYCAQQVILFARGWDLMDQDQDGCGGPGYGISAPGGNPSNGTSATSNTLANGSQVSCVITTSGSVNYTGEERDQMNDAGLSLTTPSPSFYKLGDIFHSAPVLIHPPSSEPICRLGTDNQCVRTLFGYTSSVNYGTGYQTNLQSYPGCTTGSPAVDAYRAWRTAEASREYVVLVGSNDGFLHAFDAGGPDTTTGSEDSDCVWPNVTDGTGQEIWAFLPPDLLPRLRDTILNHQYMVDGNVMVRDIWVDNAPQDSSTNNPVSNAGNLLDGVKQQNEFRTVAIVGERSGGTQFAGVDVTNAFSMTPSIRPRPSFLWSFPPPLSDDAQYMAQSWSDFSPRPPPVGPVRLVPNASDRDPQAKGWVEKWIAMLNGGYDPTLNRGRAVWTVDAWTGAVVWRYTDTDFKTNIVGNASNSTTSMFPVPAGIAMMDIGDPSNGTGLDSDNFFDTATWGDLGGNLFVARFDQPGKRDPVTGRVTNWRAARAFEQGRTATDAQYGTNRNEFYYMTSNAFEPQRHTLRTLIGSGNREQILEQGQGCGPDNVMACCQAGCSVSTSTELNYGVCNSSSTFACSATGQMTVPTPFSQGCGTSGASACTGGASNTFVETSSYNLNCGAGNASTAGGNSTCQSTGLCSVTPVGTGHDLTPSSAGTCTDKAKFYGIWAYGGLGISQKVFSTVATADYSTAVTFDQNRFTDAPAFKKGSLCNFTPSQTCSLVETTQASVSPEGVVTCLDSSPTCQATVDDPGWFYTYNVTCPTSVSCGSGCNNEKTASGSAVVNSCVTWNTFLPQGSASSGSDPCAGAQTATQSTYAYSSNFVSGVATASCNQGENISQDLLYLAVQRSTIAPPAAPMVQNSITATGKVYYSTLQINPGAPVTSTSAGSRNVASSLYWLEVPRDLHMCRHQDNTQCE